MIGATLLIVDSYFGIDMNVMAMAIIGLAACGVALVYLAIKKGFFDLLMDSLSKRVMTNRSIHKGLRVTEYPEEVIYVLKAAETVNREEFEKLLFQSLDSPHEQVRIYSMQKIEQHKIKSFAKKLMQICETEQNPTVLGASFLAYGSIGDLNTLKKHLNAASADVATSCMTAFIRYGSATEKTDMAQILKEKSRSVDEEARISAAQALKHIELSDKIEILLDLLNDKSDKVKAAAAEVAVNQTDKRVVQAVIALHAPCSLSEERHFEYMLENFDQYPLQAQIHLITLLGHVKEKSVEILEKLLPNVSRNLLHPLLQSLKKHSYRALDEQLIEKLIVNEGKNIVFLREFISYFHVEKMKELRSFLCREVEFSQECCFYLLSFVYPEEAIMKVKMSLATEDEETNSNAVELLVQTLETKDHKLIDQLNYFPHKQECEDEVEELELIELLIKIRDYTDNCHDATLPNAIIYELGILKLKRLVDLVVKEELKSQKLAVS